MNNASTAQPPPRRGRQRVGKIVLADIQERIRMGHKRYNCYLETDNGRDSLWDAYQEAIDLVMYLRQTILERDERSKP